MQPKVPSNSAIASRMEQDWDARARENAEFYIATGNERWSPEDFFRGGKINVENDILADPQLIRGDGEFSRMRVLEIGCGAGRMTRAMAEAFAEVHAVDISAEMIALATRNLSDLRNVFLHKNNGVDLSGLPSRSCDLAFSFIVFQHIPSRNVIENYIREVHRCLKPGGMFKFQVQGCMAVESTHEDTWMGVPMSLDDARALARLCGFELLCSSGEGTQYFWLWFQKPKWPWIPKPLQSAASQALRHVRNALRKRARLTFSTRKVRPGETYIVAVPAFPGQVIDIAYEYSPAQKAPPVIGVVVEWCQLDSRGKARIPVPADHPAGRVRITGVRSRTHCGPWFRTNKTIEVAPKLAP